MFSCQRTSYGVQASLQKHYNLYITENKKLTCVSGHTDR
jgi:hypothetical protein